MCSEAPGILFRQYKTTTRIHLGTLTIRKTARVTGSSYQVTQRRTDFRNMRANEHAYQAAFTLSRPYASQSCDACLLPQPQLVRIIA